MTGEGNGQQPPGGWAGYAPGMAVPAPNGAPAPPALPALPPAQSMTHTAPPPPAPMRSGGGNIMSGGGAPPPMAPPGAAAPVAVRPPQAPGYGAPMMVPQPMAPHMMVPGAPPPMGMIPQEGSHMLGLATLAVGAGSLIGLKLGGIWGGLAGSLVGGAVVNAYRALHYYKEGTAEGDKEARVAATYAVLTTAVGGYVFATKAKTPVPGAPVRITNPADEDDEEPDDEPETLSALEQPPALPPPAETEHDEEPDSEPPCGMRPAGP